MTFTFCIVVYPGALGVPATSPAHFPDYKDLPAKKRASLCSSSINPKVPDILTGEPARTPAFPGRKLQIQKPVAMILSAKSKWHWARRRRYQGPAWRKGLEKTELARNP
jgi:hypothetical protein